MRSVSPDGRWLAFSLGDSLFVQPIHAGTERGRARAVTGGMTAEASMAIPFVAWSPDGSRLAIRSGHDGPEGIGTRTGTPHVIDLARDFAVTPLLPDSLARSIRTFRSFLTGPPAWSPDGGRLAFIGWEDADAFTTRVYVADVASRAVVRLDVGSAEPYGVTWSPDGRRLIVTQGAFRGRDGAVAVHTADAPFLQTTVFRGGSSLYRSPLWFPDGARLMVRDVAGIPTILELSASGELTALPRSLPARRYAGFVGDGRALVATVRDGMRSLLTRVDVASGREDTLLQSGFLYDAVGVAPHGADDLVVFTMEAGDRPPEFWTAAVSPEGPPGKPVQLTALNDRLDPRRLARSELYTWVVDDSIRLETQLFLPRSDAEGLPLVVMPYGGYRDAFPGSDDFLAAGIQALVARGFAVARPNTRGLASEGQVDGRYGEVQLADTHALIDALSRDGVVDPDRVVLLGHSHGGAMVYYFLTHSRRFAGGIAVNGAADWVFQADLARTGMGMVGLPGGMGGTPEDEPDTYRRFSPLAQFREVSAPLLGVTGSLDTQIPEAQTGAMVDSLVGVGRDARWVSFPDEGHTLTKPENVRAFWSEVLAFVARAAAR